MERFSTVNFEINDLSAEDFQEKLYQWLEEQGILPGLRTYLRHQLVSALKRTHLSSDFQYTASIFYSEEPRLGQLPIQLRLSNEGGESSKFFTETEVEEILQSLNIVHSSEFVREVVDSYSKHPTSLLKAIVKSFAAQSKNIPHKKPDSLGDAFAEEEYSTINKSNERASAEKVNKLQALRNQLGKSIARDKENSSCTSESKQSEINKRVEDAVMKMKEEMEREMAEQRKTMEDGLMAKQQRIIEMVNHLQDQQIKLQDHFKNMKEKEELLDLKEKRFEGIQHQESIRIAEEHNQIKSSQQKLEEEFQRLRQEKNALILLQKEMEATHKQIIEVANYLGNSQMELDVIQSLNLEDKQKMENKGGHPNKMNGISSHGTMTLTQSLHSMQENAIQVYQRAVNELREKNVKLQSLANEQQSKISKLSVTVSSLSSQLEDATAALRLLSEADDNKTKMQPIESHLTFPVKEKFEQKVPEGAHREKQYERSFKRSNEKRFRRRREEESDSSTASSPTEEILREARHRLQKLEIESDEVDRRYYKFKQKHLLEGFRVTSLNISQDKLSSPERNTSRTKCSHITGTHNDYEKRRSIAELDYAYPIENNPMNGKQVSLIFTSNHSEYNKEAENFKEKSDSKLSNNNGSAQIKSIARHTNWIGCGNKKGAKNYRESSTAINEVQKEITPLSEQLPSDGDGKEVLKEEASQKNSERHSVEKNFPDTPKISDNLTHEVHHQTSLEAADRNHEMKIEGQINSTTGNHCNYVTEKTAVESTGEEAMKKQMEGSNDSLTSSSAKISVGTNCGKADDSFW